MVKLQAIALVSNDEPRRPDVGRQALRRRIECGGRPVPLAVIRAENLFQVVLTNQLGHRPADRAVAVQPLAALRECRKRGLGEKVGARRKRGLGEKVGARLVVGPLVALHLLEYLPHLD
jgi:hypothetical protein